MICFPLPIKKVCSQPSISGFAGIEILKGAGLCQALIFHIFHRFPCTHSYARRLNAPKVFNAEAGDYFVDKSGVGGDEGERWHTLMIAHQIEFPISVVVCAWCKPGEKGRGLGEISHGICPRHLARMKRQLANGPLRRVRRKAATRDEALLPL